MDKPEGIVINDRACYTILTSDNPLTSHATLCKGSEEISNSSNIAKHKLVNNNKNDQEIDYKKQNFEYLICNIEIKVLEKCFSKILSFLDSASEELEFRNLSKNLEEILIRIVKDVNVLRTKAIYYSIRNICKNIVNKVNMYNSEIYFLACIFKQEAQNSLYAGLGGNSKNVLVYKKIFHASVPHYISSNSSRSPSPQSRSSSLDSEESHKSSYEEPPSLTDYFKSHSLNLILKFVKDKTQTSLVFSGLTAVKADFVHSIFNSVTSDNSDRVDVKKIYPQLWEAVKIFGLKYEFSIKYLDSTINKKFLLLEKMEKDNASVLTEIFDLEAVLSMPVTGKSLRKHRDALKHISSEFIISSLKKVAKFFKNESEASLIFSNVNARDTRFLKNIINYCRSHKIKTLFSKEAQDLFDEIQICDAMRIDFKIKIKQENLGGGDKLIRYVKMPLYEKRAPESRPWYPREVSKGPSKTESSAKRKKTDDKTLSENTIPPTNFGSKYGSSINFQYAGDMCNGRKDESSLVLARERDLMLAKAMDKHSLAIKPQEMMESPQLERKRGSKRVRNVGTGRQPRTTQLIEALSVPVKSDKALKMMLGMGWTGGALGSRGDGITEPIMPDLNTVAGVGLGHFKAVKQNVQLPKPPPAISTLSVSCNKKSTAKFRQLFLGQLLELLTSNEDSKTIRFHPSLKKKEKSFLRHAMRSFAARTTLQISSDEQSVVDKIIVQYEKDPELMVFACISDNKKEVVLRKKHSVVTIANRKEQIIPQEIIDNYLYNDNVQLVLDSYGPLCQSQKSYENAKFRVSILLELLRFIKNDTQHHMEVKFPKELTIKQKHNIENAVSDINKRLIFGSNKSETAMSKEIKRNMGDFNLILNINYDLMSFKVTKEYIGNTSQLQINSDTIATVDHRKSKDNDNKRDINDDLYIEDDVKITDNTPKTHKINQIVYKSHEISDNSDDYGSEIIDYKDSVNYRDNDGSIYGNKNNNIARNDDMVMEYDDLMKTDKETENADTNINDCNDIFKSTNLIGQSTKTGIDRLIIDENNDNLTTTDISVKTNRIISTTIKKVDEDVDVTTPVIVIDSDSNDSIDLVLNDKMSISELSNDYNVLGIQDVTMSDSKLSDWDGSQSDDSVKSNSKSKISNESVNKLSEIKKKILKKKTNKIKTDIKLVSLNKKFILTENLLKHVQHIISYNIKQTKQLPLLKNYGIQNGVVIYSCHDKKSYDWLLNVCVANEIIMLDEEFDKMSFKINWFYDNNDNYVFDMLHLYNKNISTNEWSILNREEMDDYMFYVVKMDKESFKFIIQSDLSLFAGVDKVQFSIVWK